MLKSKPKVQKKLAKLVLAALLATSGLQSFVVPGVAHAISAGASGTATNGVKTEVFSNLSSVYGNYILGYIAPTNCKVEITGGTAAEVVGADGYSYTNDVLGNSVTITDGTFTSVDMGGAARVIGAVQYADGPKLTDNHVTINGGTVGVMGSYPVTRVVGAYGAYSFSGEASGNTVTITAGEVNDALIAGAYNDFGLAKDNHVTIGGDAKININGSRGFDGGIYGGYSSDGDAQENTVTINGGAFSSGSSSTSRPFFEGDVAGGRSLNGNAIGNTATIGAGDFSGVYGGMAGNFNPGAGPASGDANKNTVNINGGTVGLAVGGMTGRGGLFWLGSAGGSGSSADGGNANGNFVNVNGGTAGTVVGGSTMPFSWGYGYAYGYNLTETYMATDGTANDNTVTITDGTLGTTGTYYYNEEPETWKFGGVVVGGLSMKEASGNTVTVKGGNVDGAYVIGGWIPQLEDSAVSVDELDEFSESVNASAKADNNTVNILTSANFTGLYGGITSMSETGLTFGSGNTLNIAAKDVTTYDVGGFSNMNFYLPSNIANGDTMLTIKTPTSGNDINGCVYYSYYITMGNKFNIIEGEDPIDDDGNIIAKAKPTDLTDVTFGVAALQGVNLKKGDKVTLIKDENGLTTADSLKTKDSKELGKAEFLQQNNMTTEEKYELSIKKEGDNAIVTTVDDIIENETDPDARKSPVETRAAVVTMINAAGDLLAGQGMANAEKAAEEAKGGGSSMFAAVGGNHLRAESGSHVTTKGLGLNLGFAKEIENKSGKLLIGPVLEYGHGNYDSYQDNGMKADGKASYWGIGVIAKQTNNSGFYYEGSLRVGRTKSDYGSDSIVANSHISYDSSATYFAAHLGAGMLRDIGHDNTLDYYGKYFYSHTGGDSTTIYRNGEDFDRVDFDGVNSNRIRLGARVTHAINERNKIYGGLAYQYEFSGEARATYREGAAPSPGVKGSSGMIELGWQVKPGKKSPMEIDIGVAGWVGKQRGITANVQANWTF